MIKTKKLVNYFLSGWMANFGVEPLLLLLFLRFLPLFFIFLILLSSVCRVGETMQILLLTYYAATQYLTIHLKRRRLIHALVRIVKKFTFSSNYQKVLQGSFSFLLLTYLALAELCFAQGPSTPSALQEIATSTEVVISVGEQHEIKDLKASQLSVGNPQVLGHLYRPNSRTLLLKGKKMGYSHLLYWSGPKQKGEIHVYVVSKRDQLKMGQAVNFLKELKISSHFSGDQLLIEGELTEVAQLKAVKSLILRNPNLIHFQGSLNPKLEKKVLMEVYAELWSHHLDSARCRFIDLDIECELYEHDKIAPDAKVTLQKKYPVLLQYVPSPDLQNYRIKLKVIQLESADELAIKSGLEQFTGTISNFFHFSLEEIIGKNSWNAGSQHLSYKLLAEPEIIISLDKKAEIKVGTEFGFQNQNQERGINQTDWKETGLNITLELSKMGNHYLLDYIHSMSRGENVESISFGHGKSTVQLQVNNPIKLFEVTLDSNQNKQAHLPWIGKIPLLGSLFGSQQKVDLYQKLTCLISLEKI